MKQRTRIYYTEADRALMWERWRRGESLDSIARLFDRNHSAIGGILSRSGGIRPRPRCKLAQNRALAHLVADKLRLQWSPVQVAGWLKRTYPHDETHQVSHETI